MQICAINLDLMTACLDDGSELPILTMVDADAEATEDRDEAVAIIVVTPGGILTAEIAEFEFPANHTLH